MTIPAPFSTSAIIAVNWCCTAQMLTLFMPGESAAAQFRKVALASG
jgi:hypothetical protein